LKTPIYETQHTFILAQINGKPIKTPQNIKEYLSSIYKYDLTKNFKKIPKAYLNRIDIPKNSNLFIKITIDGLSNDYDLQKRNEILHVLQNLTKNDIEQYIINIDQKIKDLEFNLKKIDIFEVQNIKQNILNINKHINLKKDLITYYKNQIKTIDQKIAFLNKNIKNYTQELNKLIKNSSKINNATVNLLISNKIISYQNLITQYNSQIQNLNLQKQKILTQQIPDIINSIQSLQDKIKQLQLTLKIIIPQKKLAIQTKIKQLKLSLSNTFNTKEVGKPLIFDHPVKPKKKLIIIVAFITGFILSIFLVFFIEFVKGLKEE
jgi:hypothetical protein